MAKAVLTIRETSQYDDQGGERYHFRQPYQLEIIRSAIGDDVLFFVPSREHVAFWGQGRVHAYIAAANIIDVIQDTQNPGYYYALIGDYVEFVRPVPFKLEGTTIESSIRNADGSTNLKAARGVVRTINDDEFALIWELGNGLAIGERAPDVKRPRRELSEAPAEFERRVVPRMVNRKVRDPIFRTAVLDAYDATCAVTGLKIINGGGAAEVEAAHIRPVEHNGSDSARNGIALCRTAHWMFDRGLIGLKGDGRFEVNTRQVPEPARRMLRQDGRLMPPRNPSFRPAETSINWHWTHRFEPKLR